MSKHETNIEFVTRVMDFADTGPLMQAFVLQALEQYAKTVAKASDADLGGDLAMVPPDVWRRCATELSAKIKEHLS